MSGFKNEFSWSKTRDDLFHKCPRQYYYHYYGSWGGWHRHSDERTRKLYVLKKLSNKHMWAGEKIHLAIKQHLTHLREGDDVLTEEEVIRDVLDQMRKEFRDSRNGLHWVSTQNRGLFEHEYDAEMSDEAWKDVANHVEKCVHNFFQSPILTEIGMIPKEQWLSIKDLGHFELNDVKVYVSIDFATKEKESVTIYDWKTGTSLSQDHDLQMACYGWFAWHHWNVDPKKIKLVEINLINSKTETLSVQGINLEKVQKRIFSSIQDMQFLLDDIANNHATEEKFPLTDNERFCSYCHFKKLCPKWEEAEAEKANT